MGRSARWRVGKIGSAGIMPSDDCIRRRFEARAEACSGECSRCSMIAQAIAFNLFLAFSPTLLIAVGVATSPIGLPNLFD